ncbi:YegJ family protein [Campylobacter concisus]
MSFFKKILGKQIDLGKQMPIYFVSSDEDYMQRAFEQARESFRYFWREVYWERRRIVPMLDYAMVKICFLDVVNGEEVGEHMWIDDVEFDGETIYGTLINGPDAVQNVKLGDQISAKIDEMSDWLFSIDGRAYGGFSVQAMRSRMQKKELKEHDKEWRLDFGDFNDILVVYEQKEHPENLIEHPMSKNTYEQVKQYIKEHPNMVTDADGFGYTQLHNEAIAGNLNLVNLLLENGADKNVRTKSGKTAADFAENLGWSEIAKVLK